MQLSKNQLEAVRYQIKKLNQTCTNDEIRNCANNFDNFDAILIANQIINNRINDIVPQNEENSIIIENNNDDGMISLFNRDTHTQSTLTTTQKHALIQIKSQELGINLNINEVQKISDMVSIQISDSINFLNEVGIIIKEYFDSRNNNVKNIVNQKIEDIATIINTKNEELGDIFNDANQKLIGIATECNNQSIDYKSIYQDKLESIKEILKLSA